MGSDWLSGYYMFLDRYKRDPVDLEDLFDGLNFASCDTEIKILLSKR
jgi:hypothetical protein